MLAKSMLSFDLLCTLCIGSANAQSTTSPAVTPPDATASRRRLAVRFSATLLQRPRMWLRRLTRLRVLPAQHPPTSSRRAPKTAISQTERRRREAATRPRPAQQRPAIVCSR